MKGFGTLRSRGLLLRSETSVEAVDSAIRNAVIPSVAIFPLLQHTGTPALPVVEVGDRVYEGMMIAQSSGPLSVPVHSSIPGVVAGRRSLRLPNGERSDALTVQLEGEFTRFGRPKGGEGGAPPGRAELLEAMRKVGLVTLDTEAVPLHARWSLPRGKRVERLIVSAVNDEPYLTVEHRLSLERLEALEAGLALAITVLRPETVVLAAEAPPLEGELPPGLRDLIDGLRSVTAEAGGEFTSLTVGREYPRGEARELARRSGGPAVEPGMSLLDLGIIVTNCSTLVALSDTVQSGRPLIERYITVGGGAVAAPATLRARIGTRVKDLIDECGGFSELPERVLVGGPLTGSVIYDLDTPVTKNTNAILALTKAETHDRSPLPCVNCGRCLTACPEELNPIALYKAVDHGRYDPTVVKGLDECTECGSCSVVCPSRIPILYGLRMGKRAVRRGVGLE